MPTRKRLPTDSPAAPNRKRLTEANVLTLPVKKKPYRVSDEGTEAARGLQVLIQPTGTKTYRAHYAKGRAIKLGRVGEMTLQEARDETRKMRRLAKTGHDPRQHDPRHAGTFGELLDVWNRIEQVGRKNNSSAERTLTLMKSSCADWLGRPVASITYNVVEELLHNKRDAGKGYMANRLHGHLMTFFRWTVRSHRLTINPMGEMPRPWNGGKPRDRDWFKQEAADKVIRKLWLFADKRNSDAGRFIKLLLITGKRKSVVLKMRWEEVDKDWNWTPPSGSKTKRNHPIPLPKLARTVLESCSRSRPTVLEGVREQQLLKDVRKGIEVPDFYWHGLRDVVETKMAELRIPWDTRDMVLDHVIVRGAGKGYDKHDYRDVKLEALETWCAHICKQVDPKGVKVLR